MISDGLICFIGTREFIMRRLYSFVEILSWFMMHWSNVTSDYSLVRWKRLGQHSNKNEWLKSESRRERTQYFLQFKFAFHSWPTGKVSVFWHDRRKDTPSMLYRGATRTAEAAWLSVSSKREDSSNFDQGQLQQKAIKTQEIILHI